MVSKAELMWFRRGKRRLETERESEKERESARV